MDQLSTIGVKCAKMASIDKGASKYPTINNWTVEAVTTIRKILNNS